MKTILIILISLVAGYVLRGYFSPYMIARMLPQTAVTKPLINNVTKASDARGNLEIVYKNGRFQPSEADMGVSRFLYVTNISDQLMWIESDYPGLSTVRGYATGEQVNMRIDRAVTIHIKNKLNVDAAATINVVP